MAIGKLIYMYLSDAAGNSMVGGSVSTKLAGTSTDVAVYTDGALTTPAANPVVDADSDSIVSFYIDPQKSYKFILNNASAAIIRTIDNWDVRSPNLYSQYATITTNTTLVYNDSGKLLNTSAASGNVTITLPAISTVAAGWSTTIVRSDSSTNTLTIARAGSDTFDDATTSQLISSTRSSLTVFSNGATWSIMPSVNISSVIAISTVASAVNTWKFTSAATGNPPLAQSVGEANIGWNLLDSNSNEIIRGRSIAAAVNEVTVTNAATGTPPIISATGGDTNINLSLTPKGTGLIVANTAAIQINNGSFPVNIVPGTLTALRTVNLPDSDISRFLVNVGYAESKTGAAGSTVIPFDNTTPLITEGDQYLSLSHTAKLATNNLLISVVLVGSTATNSDLVTVTLWQGSTLIGVVSSPTSSSASASLTTVSLNVKVAAGTISSQTFTVRAGATVGAFAFNSTQGAAKYNGNLTSSITILEYS